MYVYLHIQNLAGMGGSRENVFSDSFLLKLPKDYRREHKDRDTSPSLDDTKSFQILLK